MYSSEEKFSHKIKLIAIHPRPFKLSTLMTTPDFQCRSSELVQELPVVGVGRLDRVGSWRESSRVVAVHHMGRGLPVPGIRHSQGVLQGAEPDHRSQGRDLLVVHLEEHL